MRLKVKICCIGNKEEAKLAIEYGASAVGLVGKMPTGPGIISDKEIKLIAAIVPPPVATFLLTSETTANSIIERHQRVNTNTIQIVDKMKTGTYSDIRKAIPSVKLVQVIHVLDERSVEEAIIVAEQVDAILLDSGNPYAENKILGGTGKVHDWKLSRKIRDSVNIPVFLAGGLTPENVISAIEQVEPFGIDVCSGVRINSKLDKLKLEKFMKGVEQF